MAADRLPDTLRYYAALAPIVGSALVRVAVLWTAERFTGPSVTRASAAFRVWCRATVRHLGVRVRVFGAPSDRPCIYLANHRSYLDILLLGGVLDGSFVSRADIAEWPVIGLVARGLGTVFIDRDDPRSGARAARALARCARSRSVIVFPEGSTYGERLPQPFPDGLFRLLERLDAPVVPVTIRYGDRRVYWTDGLSIGDHLRTRVLPADPIAAAVHIGGRLCAADYDGGEAFGAAAYRAVCDPIEQLGELVSAE